MNGDNMENQMKIIKLINEIDNLVKDDYFFDEVYFENFEDQFQIFSQKLNQIFEDGLNEELLQMINQLKYKEIFRIPICKDYIQNKIRIEIEEYLNYHDQLYLNYDLIQKNIKDNYKLVLYLKDKSKVVKLIDMNEKVLLLMDGKYATKELIEKQLKKSDFVSKIFLGIYGTDNDIYRFSDFYKNVDEIDKILFEQVKNILIKDPTLFINASGLIKNNKEIQQLMISIDQKYQSYFS